MKNDSSNNHHHHHHSCHSGDLDLYGNLRVGGHALFQHHALVKGDLRVEGALSCRHLEGHDKGLFISTEALYAAIPSPHIGDWAFVANASRLQLWQCQSEGVWTQIEVPADFYSMFNQKTTEIMSELNRIDSENKRQEDSLEDLWAQTSGMKDDLGQLETRLSQTDSVAVKTISVNNSPKLHPDDSGNIDLALPTASGEGGADWSEAITDLSGRLGQVEYQFSREIGIMEASLAQTRQDVANLMETVGDGDFYDSPNDLLHRIEALSSAITELREEMAQLAREITGGGDEAPERFDVAKGNPGAFSIENSPEDITVEMVRNAYAVPDLYPDAPVGPEHAGTPHIWTAAEVGLVEGSTDAVGTNNVTRLKAALADVNCLGVKLDRQYRLNVPFAGDSATVPSSYINGVNTNNGGSIIIPRDFVIDGEVNGEAVGGFVSGAHWSAYTTGKSNLFYTEHSLNLRKVHTTTNHSAGAPYVAYYIDCRKGIDQLQVTGCVFDDNNGKGRNYIGMYFADEVPHADWVPVDSNCVNHIYVDGCVSEGDLISNLKLASRVAKSFRITNNTVTDIVEMGVCFSTANNRNYSNLMAYMSCPLWLAGNRFEGKNELVRSSTDYYCGALIENSVLYSLHNRFENFIAGECYLGGGGTNNVATYDEYFNGRQLFFANNTSLNIVYMSMYKANSGYLKAKGNGYMPSNLDGTHLPLTRYFKNNRMLLCPTDVEAVWNARMSSGSDDIDHSEENLSLSEVMTIFIDVYTGAHPLKDFIFSGNEVNARWSGTEGVDDPATGNIMGSLESTRWWATHFTIEDNTFRASRISSVQWGYKSHNGVAYSSTWLFPLQLDDFWGATSLHVRDNEFLVAEDETVNLYVSRYTQATQVSGVLPIPSDYLFSDNDITQGSTIRTTTLCTNPWGSHVIWESVVGAI